MLGRVDGRSLGVLVTRSGSDGCLLMQRVLGSCGLAETLSNTSTI